MRVDSPKGIKAWLQGYFSGSFKGHLIGTADTASYVNSGSVDGLDRMFKEFDEKVAESYLPITGGLVRGDVTIGPTCDEDSKNKKPIRSSHLIVHGNIRTGGIVQVDGGVLEIKKSRLVYDEELGELQVRFDDYLPEPPEVEVPPEDPEPEETGSCCCCKSNKQE